VSKRKAKPPKVSQLTQWDIMLCAGPGILDVVSEPWGAWWLTSVSKGERDCACCGGLLAAATEHCPVLVGATKVERQWLIATMCAKCARDHGSMEEAGTALCKTTLAQFGHNDARVVAPMPEHKSVQ
jgi:hypothetical protein